MYVLTVIEHANRRIRGLGYDRTPDRFLGGAGRKDTVLADAGIEVVLGGVRIPRMNSIMERCVQTRRRELLDWTLIWNQRHLLHALREVRRFYNGHRPHQGIANAAPPRPLPAPSPIRRRSPASTYVDTNRSAASGTSTDMRRDQRGWG